MTEEQMRNLEVKTPKSLDDLVTFIKSLENEADEYGKAAYCASLSAYAAFMYIARREGLTGFQASCADLDFIRRTRGIDGPFMIIQLENYLLPQYNLVQKLNDFIEKNKFWIKEEAKKKLIEYGNYADPGVVQHWKELAE